MGVILNNGGKGKAHPGFRDEDGFEEVEAWECVEGCPVAEMDRQSAEAGMHSAGSAKPAGGWPDTPDGMFGIGGGNFGGARKGDSGGASRFYYVAKASRGERNAGLEGFEKKPLLWSSGEQNPGSFQAEGTDRSARNPHPTVKPIDVMRWLVRLVTPPGGTVLDPFTGSGTTGIACVLEGFDFIGCEKEEMYVEIAQARIKFWVEGGERALAELRESEAKERTGVKKREAVAETGQLDLLGGS